MIRIRFRDSKTEYSPGETLEGVVEWALDERPEQIDVCLLWYTEGRGTQDIGIVSREVLKNVQAGGERRFSFKLPLRPYSFEGMLISLSWAVEAVDPESEESVRENFTLAPDGKPYVLEVSEKKSLTTGLKIRVGKNA